MTDGTNTKAWQKFLQELEREEVEFSTIQYADEATRAQLLGSMNGLSPLERASISSTWTRLANKQKGDAGSPAPANNANNNVAPLPVKEPVLSRERSIQQQPSAANFHAQPSTSNFAAQQSFGSPQVSQVLSGEYQGSPPGGRQQQPPVQVPPPARGVPIGTSSPMLSVPVMNLGISGSDVASLLRTALDRGDCSTALPLASEMLQTDPNGLVYMLNEFLPQLSIEQLKTILGVGVPLGQEPSPGSFSSGSPARYAPPSVPTFFGSPDGSNSPAVEMTSQPTLNGQPLTAGQVLTAHNIQAQFGPRFTATCNGSTLKFPYCVQRGDKIVVRSAAERLL